MFQPARPFFMLLRRFLVSSRRFTEALVGLVARRRFGGCTAFPINSARRAIASRRFCSWVRKRVAEITTMPSTVIRRPAKVRSRANTACDNAGLWRALKRNCTPVSVLLTFCPPGPGERINRSSISRSSKEMAVVIGIIL